MTTSNTKEPVTKDDLIEVLGVFKGEIIAEIDILATATKKGFDEVDEKFQVVNGRLDKIEGRLDRVEYRLDKVENRLDTIDGHLENIENNHTPRITILESQMKVVYPK